MQIQKFENGLTVRELKEILRFAPERDENGEDFEVWIETDGNLSNVVKKVWPLNRGDILLTHKI